jgi:RNA polymerase sigma factor (sigma-70 family)
MKYSDEEIIESIMKGNNRDVLTYLYSEVLPKVKSYVCKNNGTSDAAFDVFQDGMVAFYRFVKEEKFNRRYQVTAFIFIICRNLWATKAKRDKRSVHLDNALEQISDSAIDALEYIITNERETLVRNVLQQLGNKCQELLKYSVYDDLSTREICEIMGFTSEDAVKTQKYKCKQKLAELLKTSSISVM